MINCDVLVIGGGETGIRAAIEVKRQGVENVLLVTKGAFGTSGVMFSELNYGMDMQAATGENDPTDNKNVHLQDILRAAQGTCNENMARIMTEESYDCLKELQDIFGLELVENPDGTPRQVHGCFSSKRRAYQFAHITEIKQKYADGIAKNNINMIDNVMIVDLLIENGSCIGAVGIDRDGNITEIYAGATILATGGATGMYKHNFASPGMCGDGYSLALRAGCKLVNMEFMQFGLGILEPKYRALFLDRLMYLQPKVNFAYDHHFPCDVSEMLTVHSKHFPFSTVDSSYLFDVAVLEESIMNGGKGVSVELSVIPKEKLEEIPVWDMYYNYFDKDKNPYDNTLWITNFAHACNGGVLIDENASTGIAGLYAAGEMAAGPHGANRLGGNMHAACQVFGTRAGKNAAQYSRLHKQAVTFEPVKLPDSRNDLSAANYEAAIQAIGDILWEQVSVCRCEEGLNAALKVVEDGCRLLEAGIPENQYLWNYYELRSTTIAAKAIIMSALERRETRGSHYRKDYPHMDETAYLVNIMFKDNQIVAERQHCL